MPRKPAYALMSVVLVLTLAGLACGGGGRAPTTAPTNPASTQASQPTSVPTQAPAATATQPSVTATTAATAAATAAATTAPSPTLPPLSGKLDLHAVNTYLDANKYFHVVGLVTNGTDKPVKYIVMGLTIADSSGKSVLKDYSGKPTSTVTVYTFLTTLASGETTPFEYELNSEGADTSGWQAKPTISTSETADAPHRVKVNVANELLTFNSNGFVYLTGELVNTGDKPAQFSVVAVAMLDGPDKVAGASVISVARLLAAAGDASGLDRTPFVISIAGPVKAGATPTYYVDAIEGNPDHLKNTADLHLYLNNAFIDADNRVHVVATIGNSGTATVTVSVVAGLYDQAGKVLDADSLSTPFYLVPGGSSPAAFRYFGNVNGDADLANKVVSYTAQLDPYWTFPISSPLVALQATNVTTEASGSSVTIKGNVENTTKQNVHIPTVVVVVRDANGKVIAADWTFAKGTDPLKPGAKTDFSLTMQVPPKADPATLKYEVLAQSRVSK